MRGVLVVLCTCPWSGGAEPGRGPPITGSLARGGGFATFTNRLHRGNRIGYRFHEHVPITHGPVCESGSSADVDAAAGLERRFAKRPGVISRAFEVEDEGWVPQEWTFHTVPVEDGVDLLLVVRTHDRGLNAYYGVQQCFRMSGRTNAEWRRTIAETPAFSEYDLWRSAEKDASAKTSLTYVLRKGRWEALPATDSTVGARTPLGVRVDTERTGGDLGKMPKVGPYKARMLAPIDDGLIARRDKAGTWVCGIYWERTSHVTDHHPADCLHSIVDVGGVPPRSMRVVRGKIYWFKGTLDELRERWRRDFPSGSSRPD